MFKKKTKSDIFLNLGLSTFLSLLLSLFLSNIYSEKGLSGTLEKIDVINNDYLKIFSFNKYFFIIFPIIFAIFLLIPYLNLGKNFKRGYEHGSARLEDANVINKEISDKEYENNRILTKNIRLSIIGRKTLASLNTLVLGGMGSGKSFFTLIPNILQANTSFVITDPSKELVKATGNFLKMVGYKVKVLDLEDFIYSAKYNFFKYINSDADIKRVTDIIFKSTVPKEKIGGAQDPMWDNMAKDYLQALIGLIYYMGAPDEQNINTLIWLLNEDKLIEGEGGQRVETVVMAMFDELEKRIGPNMATDAYRSATDGAVITIQGVKSNLRGRLGSFYIPEVRNLMERDELELEKIGFEKTALFLAVPSEDTSFNFIVNILYAQLFPILYRKAREMKNNRLPVDVQFLIDEMANFVMPEDFPKYTTTSRKHGISFMMFFQEMSQIEKMFGKEKNTIIGTCNTFLYLKGSGFETNKYISEWIGKETVTAENYSRSYGRNGNSSRSQNQGARNVLTPDEIDISLGKDEALLYAAGYGFAKDKKNDPKTHPNFKYTSYEEGSVYDWTGKEMRMFDIKKSKNNTKKADYEISDIQKINIDKLEKELKFEVYEGE